MAGRGAGMASVNDPSVSGSSVNGPGVTAIEWAEKIEPLLPPRTTRIRLESVGENTHRIEVA